MVNGTLRQPSLNILDELLSEAGSRPGTAHRFVLAARHSIVPGHRAMRFCPLVEGQVPEKSFS